MTHAFQPSTSVTSAESLFTSGPMAILWWRHGEPVALLGNAPQVLGDQRAEALAHQAADYAQFIWPEDLSAYRQCMQTLTCGQAVFQELTYRLDCGARWILQRSYADYAQAQLTGIRSYLIDVTVQKQTELSLQAGVERMSHALASANTGTWELDLERGSFTVCGICAHLMGYPQVERTLAWDHWTSFVYPQDVARLSAMRDDLRREARQADTTASFPSLDIEYRVRHQQGHYIWVNTVGTLTRRSPEGRALRVVGNFRDVSAEKVVELRRMQQQQLLDLVNDVQKAFLLDKSLVSACDKLFTPLLNMTESQFGFIGILCRDDQGRDFLEVPSISNISWDEASRAWYDTHRRDGQAIRFYNLNNLFGHVVTHNTMVCTHEVPQHVASHGTPAGHPVLECFLGIPLRFNNEAVGMIALANRPDGFDDALIDILAPLVTTLGTLIHARYLEEQRAQAESALFLQATRDPLTGLLNRRHFFDQVERQLALDRRYGSQSVLALMDVDFFKSVNDQYGHAAGDKTLQVLSELMQLEFRDADLRARMGGEEFAVLLPQTSLEQAVTALERFREALQGQQIPLETKEHLSVTISIGVSLWNPTLPALDHWMSCADAALYQAKREGRNRLCIFSG